MTTECLGGEGKCVSSLQFGNEAKDFGQVDKSSNEKNRCTLCPRNCIIRPGCILSFLEINSGNLKKD